jgi:hypothetical protein
VLTVQSTLLDKLTATSSEVGAYEFTTLTCIPGNIEVTSSRILPLMPALPDERTSSRILPLMHALPDERTSARILPLMPALPDEALLPYVNLRELTVKAARKIV